ncbi:2-oxo-4-hydroxy-4-carboxy-5-ureidoimidazoline decarboxylase [Leifsonia sp. YAF41]|uniref:2-oxo-4-hydroxy-4-carboxy-5-ureidoimidazoline decarboxylase n=1 Tax=Leifsonia sp. YAF41 TaxID=3233086 RepID=UPI003F95B4D4
MLLTEFNEASRPSAVAVLRPCVDVRRWCEQIADARPFASKDALMGAARRAASPFTNEEVEEALAQHPKIGEHASGDGREAAMSRSEQAGVDASDAAVMAALAAGNLAYERKFGRVFLICAAGRSAAEILAVLRQRLGNDASEEDRIVAEQLREIALLRLDGAVAA